MDLVNDYALEYLSQFFKITVFYYNPNIYPSSEYDDRINEQKKVINFTKCKIEYFIEGKYDTKIPMMQLRG